MKIRAIKTYQAVTFNKANETSFTTLQIRNKLPVEFKFLKEMNAIEVKNDLDHVIIPMANIAAIYVWTEEKKKEVAKNKEDLKPKKSTLRASDIKRPF